MTTDPSITLKEEKSSVQNSETGLSIKDKCNSSVDERGLGCSLEGVWHDKEDRECATSSATATAADEGIVQENMDEGQELREPRYPRLVEMHTTADWWSLWIGLLSFALACALAFLVPYEQGSSRIRYVVPQPMKWTNNPLDAWDLYAIIGTFLLLSVLCVLYLISLLAMGKLKKNPVSKYIKGFAAMSVLATISFWFGRNEWCAGRGFGYAIFAILLGMAIANSPLARGDDKLDWLKLAAKDGEFFIKCSLVLLAVEFSVLGDIGLPAIAVAWIGSPVALVIGYLVGTRFFKMDKGLALLIATGSTWCGASAISAIGSVIGSSSGDISLSISVVVAFTVIFTFAQPYFAIGVGMDERVAGAWIGGSVDQTGNVLVSAAIVSEEATEVAGIVKIVLNSGLGILATMVSFWWQTRAENREENDATISMLVIWDKFPKFVLGYLICSGILSLVLPRVEEDTEGLALRRAVITLNNWWFAIAFVGIGIGTNFRELWEAAVKSGVIQLYLIANAIDIALALGLAYIFF